MLLLAVLHEVLLNMRSKLSSSNLDIEDVGYRL